VDNALFVSGLERFRDGSREPDRLIHRELVFSVQLETICAFTTDLTEAPIFRLLVESTEENGLRAESRLMVDKLTTVPKVKIGSRIGKLADSDLLRLNRAVVVFLGLAGSSRS
jgi:mRNA interferase MazF